MSLRGTGIIACCILALLTATASGQQTDQLARKLETVAQPVREVLRKAHGCHATVTSERILFCTGLDLDRPAVSKLRALTFTECKAALLSAGYTPLNRYSSKSLSRESWDLFEKSTKRAEALHDEKLVLFRDYATTTDCVHELLHVMQRSPSNKGELQPLRRAELLRGAQAGLLGVVNEIETEERRGNPKLGLALKSSVETVIEELRQVSALVSTLDEVEVHRVIEYGCRKWWKCTEEETETALANLYQLRTLLAAEEAIRVDGEVQRRIAQKLELQAAWVLKAWKCITSEQRAKVKDFDSLRRYQRENNSWLSGLDAQVEETQKRFLSGQANRAEHDKLLMKRRAAELVGLLEACRLTPDALCADLGTNRNTKAVDAIREKLNQCDH